MDKPDLHDKLLSDAHSLTNGNRGDLGVMSDVLYGLTIVCMQIQTKGCAMRCARSEQWASIGRVLAAVIPVCVAVVAVVWKIMAS